MKPAAGKPVTARDWIDIGIGLNNKGQFEESLPIHEQAIAQCQEDLLSAVCNKGVALAELGRTSEAVLLFTDLLAQKPDYLPARLNRGRALMQGGRLEHAVDDYDKAISCGDPSMEQAARFGKGFAQLVMGDLREGFKGFESRRMPLYAPPPSAKQWNGQELAGKTILVLGEMGLGDNIMFLRYAPMLRAIGAEVIVAVPPPMKPLAECIDGIKAISGGHPRFDYWVRMMSLAHRFDTDLDTVPPPAQFVLSPIAKEVWQMPMGKKLKVGLCWSGSRESEYYRHRNIPLAALAPLLEIDGVDFFSLVVDVWDGDREAFDKADVFDVGKKVQHFRDTACVVAGLDLVITCDTSVAHLAGSVGVPTWVMLTSFRTYWLWIRDRDDCPWYPRMKAFRQASDGDWAEVVNRVCESLRAILARRT